MTNKRMGIAIKTPRPEREFCTSRLAPFFLYSRQGGAALCDGEAREVPQSDPRGQNPKGMHVFIWAGLKSTGRSA